MAAQRQLPACRCLTIERHPEIVLRKRSSLCASRLEHRIREPGFFPERDRPRRRDRVSRRNLLSCCGSGWLQRHWLRCRAGINLCEQRRNDSRCCNARWDVCVRGQQERDGPGRWNQWEHRRGGHSARQWRKFHLGHHSDRTDCHRWKCHSRHHAFAGRHTFICHLRNRR